MKALNAAITFLLRNHRKFLIPHTPVQHLVPPELIYEGQTIFGQFFVRRMAGHSKWQNIKSQKQKNDTLKANIFNRHCLHIRRAVLKDGPDPKLNNQLASIIQTARKDNMPNSTIESVIKKTMAANMKLGEIEVIGPGGCLMLLEVESGNINRTVHDVKQILKRSKLGLIAKDKRSRMLFESKGIVRVSGMKDGSKLDPEKAMDDAIMADAEDVQESVDVDGKPVLMFISSTEYYGKMKKWFDESNYIVQDSGLEYVARSPLDLPEDQLELAIQLCSQLEELDDVLKVNVNIR